MLFNIQNSFHHWMLFYSLLCIPSSSRQTNVMYVTVRDESGSVLKTVL